MSMNTVKTHKEIPTRTVLRAVIIYDEFDSAAHATALLERVGRRVSEAIKWDLKPWRYDVLRQPALAALTIAVAANADLIVLALHRTHFPPAELLEWLTNWAQHRRIEDAAVLMLHAETGDQRSKAWNEIKLFAVMHHLTFLGSHEVAAYDYSSASRIHRLSPHRQLVPAPRPSVDKRLTTPQPWKINE